MTKRWPTILFAAIAAATSVSPPAAAQPDTPPDLRSAMSVTIPDGWQRDVDESRRYTSTAHNETSLADALVTAAGEQWQPAAPGAMLYLMWIEHDPGDAAAETVARRLLDGVRDAPEVASLTPGEIEVVSWHEALANGVAEGQLEWRQNGLGIVTAARVLVFRDGAGRIHLLKGECPMSQAAGADVARQCRQALASIAPATTELRPLQALPPAAERDSPTGSPEAPARREDRPATTGPTIRAADPGQSPVIVVPSNASSESSGGSKWLYVVGGLLLLVAFYVTTRNRDRDQPEPESEAEAEAEPESEAEPEPEAEAEPEPEPEAEAESEADEPAQQDEDRAAQSDESSDDEPQERS